MADNGIDIWLKFTGTGEQAKNAIVALGLDELLGRDEDGILQVSDVFTRHVGLVFHQNLLTQFATYDAGGNELTPPVFSGPHLMIRLMSQAVRQKARAKLFETALDAEGNLVRKTGPGIEIVDPLGTVEWF